MAIGSPALKNSLSKAFAASFVLSSVQSSQQTVQLVQDEIQLAIDLVFQSLGFSSASLSNQINSLETNISFNIPVYNNPAGFATGLLAGTLTIGSL
jgi:hypothetical protein